MKIGHLIIVGTIGLALAACKPSSEPGVDFVKTQREGMEKAKAVEGQLQQKAQEQMKRSDETDNK